MKICSFFPLSFIRVKSLWFGDPFLAIPSREDQHTARTPC